MFEDSFFQFMNLKSGFDLKMKLGKWLVHMF